MPEILEVPFSVTKMKYTCLSLFPEIINSFFTTSIMAKAVERGIISWESINIRDYAFDKHKSCDDAPYGGGAGMLMLPEPLARALEAAGAVKKGADTIPRPRVIYLSASGKLFNQAYARALADENELILICGRYEGIDQRIIDMYVDDEVSIGDYVISSGETAALVLVDATYRLIDNVITAQSLTEESFSNGLLEYPQWTRPPVFDTLEVPEVLLSGHHENIRTWRLQKSIEKTKKNRPDLLEKVLPLEDFDGHYKSN
ncbi:MAG: tRNA (guanosine(37)-N1)-methyltransferase TrmD [Termitinemataceae bacterium]|nr:MAG: tRNA (guanosine(37)-N1)-methyltransferase TrmD [Termitinemataceae bacterium]